MLAFVWFSCFPHFFSHFPHFAISVNRIILFAGSEGISRAKIGHEDLRKHFVDYNPHMLGKLDKLHWMWADARGVASQECKLIAKLFNEAVDSAKTGYFEFMIVTSSCLILVYTAL